MDGEARLFDAETDVETCKTDAVDSIRVFLVGGAGVVPQNTDSGCLLALWQPVQQIRREVYFQKKRTGTICEAAGSISVAIAVRNVGLDVENGCAVHQVGSPNMQYSSKLCTLLHTQQFDTGKSQIIGPERGASGKNTHAGVAAKSGWTDSRGPAIAHGFRKLPNDPKMGEFLDSPQGVGIAEFRLKDDG